MIKFIIDKMFWKQFYENKPGQICIDKKSYEFMIQFQISNTVVDCETNITFLSVNIDFM